jgi:hypothetical protein
VEADALHFACADPKYGMDENAWLLECGNRASAHHARWRSLLGMGTTFVELREHGFWIRDWLLDVWLVGLHATMQHAEHEADRVFAKEMLEMARVGYMGWHPLALNELSPERLQSLATHAAKVVEVFRENPQLLEPETLNALQVSGPGEWSKPVAVSAMESVSTRMLELLGGRCEWTAGSPEALAWMRPLDE